MTMPLDGILVADFSRVLAGPLATTMLADLGAEVVKVERPGTGDDTRHWGPPWTENSSSYYESANRSKQSLELDLSIPEDLAIAHELAARADVMIENFRTGSLAARGLGFEDVTRVNPRLVYCSVTGFGSDRGAALSGYDFLLQAVGGLMSITGEVEGQPTKVGVALVDVLTSKDAVMGILAALMERERSGRGQHVEVNLLSSLLGSLVNQASSYLATGRSPRRMGNQHPSIAPYETLRCSDGLLALCCGNDRQFAALAGVLKVDSLALDARFRTNGQRVEHRAELVAELEASLLQGSVADWVARLSAAGVPAGAVGDLDSAFALADELGLDARVAMHGAAIDQVRHPVTYSRTPVTSYLPPPALGAHNEVLRQRFTPHHEERTS